MPSQLDLFLRKPIVIDHMDGLSWPPHSLFPCNTKAHTPGSIIRKDLKASPDSLIITGYSALDYLIDFIADFPSDNFPLRVILGNEPHPGNRALYSSTKNSPLPEEIRKYWLNRGVSLFRSSKIIQTIERIQSKQIQFRHLHNLHAKIYVSKTAATIGSSNFSSSGLHTQLEANTRFEQKGSKKRYIHTKQIAENFWSQGSSYNDEILKLLKELLKVVTWEEAVARAVAELLEGEWIKDYINSLEYDEDLSLWPSQIEGITQALWISRNIGGALIADATGSGKTRMGTHILRSILDRSWKNSQSRNGRVLMITPNKVQENWEHEAVRCGLPLTTYTHGVLSHSKSDEDLLRNDIKTAPVIAVDEAHNFLNKHSKRSEVLLSNIAEHIFLFTATPINKGVSDLLRIVQILGADNLEPETLKVLEKLLRRKTLANITLTEDDVQVLRKEIQKFTVRRTKTQFNQLVDQDPNRYRNSQGDLCRYPNHIANIYPLNESRQDKRIAHEINQLARKLHGVTHLSNLSLPPYYREKGMSEEQYVKWRVQSAKQLSIYHIHSCLRSSKAALIEHLIGTENACQKLGIKSDKSNSGNVFGKIDQIKKQLPTHSSSTNVPDWLSDLEQFQSVCVQDVSIYKQILELTEALSHSREESKIALLQRLRKKHGLIIAFDKKPITLSYLKVLSSKNLRKDIIIATGSSQKEQQLLTQKLSLGSHTNKLIALCSDSMAEGVNLQAASAIIHLDMPSVIRIAEQRVGRVDRMDSPHQAIEAWWPRDAAEFSVQADERFIERHRTNGILIGSNLPLPEEMSNPEDSSISVEEFISKFENSVDPWDGIGDAFEPIRQLIDKENGIVPPEIYNNYKNSTDTVLSRVSVVNSEKSWAFFCMRGSDDQAPRWILFKSPEADPVTSLDKICNYFRKHLIEAENLPLDAESSRYLEIFLRSLKISSKTLISGKKQQALQEMEIILTAYRNQLLSRKQQDEKELYLFLIEQLQQQEECDSIDWDRLADQWLEITRPIWQEQLKITRKRKILLLKDIREIVIQSRKILAPKIREAFHRIPLLDPIENRIASCIIARKL